MVPPLRIHSTVNYTRSIPVDSQHFAAGKSRQPSLHNDASQSQMTVPVSGAGDTHVSATVDEVSLMRTLIRSIYLFYPAIGYSNVPS